MSKAPDGKVRRDWYIDEEVARRLRHICADSGKRESHVVEDMIRAMLNMPSIGAFAPPPTPS